VQDACFTEGDSLSHEVQINLNMLGPLMLDRIAGEVNNTDVITKDHGSTAKRMMKLL
jgi:hypothetical protein